MDDIVRVSAQTVWDYMVLSQPVESADVLLVLGSRDDRVAEYATELCREHRFGQVMISGGQLRIIQS